MKIGIFFEGRKKKDMGGGFYLQLRDAELIYSLKNNDNEICFISSDENTSDVLKKKKYKFLFYKTNFFKKLISKLFNVDYFKDLFQKFNFHHPFYNFLKKEQFDLIIFLNPSNFAQNCEDISFVINIWDLDHKYNSQFPEHNVNNTYENREKLIQNVIFRAFKVLVPHKKIKDDLVKIYKCNKDTIYLRTLIPYPPKIYEKNKEKINYKEEFEKLNLPKNKKLIFYPAAYWPHKNHKYIIDSILKIDDLKQNYHFLFCGPNIGNYDFIKEQIKINDLKNYITTFELINDNQLISIYLNCSAVVMPTFGGPTNLPIFESFYFKKPIFYTKHLIDDDLKKCLITIDINNEHDFANKIKRLNDENFVRELTKKASDYYKKNCNENEFIKVYEKIFSDYRHLMNRWKI